jgi:hypothetical protein
LLWRDEIAGQRVDVHFGYGDVRTILLDSGICHEVVEGELFPSSGVEPPDGDIAIISCNMWVQKNNIRALAFHDRRWQ